MSKSKEEKSLVHLGSDLDNMEDITKKMLIQCEEIVSTIENARQIITDSKKVFDTPSATYFRKIVDDYIEQQKLFINNDIIPSTELLSNIIDLYDEEYNMELNCVKGDNKKEEKNG